VWATLTRQHRVGADALRRDTYDDALPDAGADRRHVNTPDGMATELSFEAPLPSTGTTAPPVIVLITSNGTGMGHLTRQLTVALGLGDQARAHVFSLSLAAPVVTAHGLPGEYCPSYDRGWVPRHRWNTYLHDRIVAFCKEVRADAVLFDGVSPYAGILSAKSALPHIPFAWCRRGMWRPDVNTTALEGSSAFDLVIEPGDLGFAADRGPTSVLTDAIRIPPVTLVEVIDRLSRFEAATALGLDPNRPTALVTLGSGRLGDPTAAASAVIEELLSEPHWQVAVTRAGIAKAGLPSVHAERVIELHDVYPLARYLHAFDAAVSAAGYNAVHEFLPAAIPTLLVPSPVTATDDQVARAVECARLGFSLWAHPDDIDAVRTGTRELLKEETREHLRAACVKQQARQPATGGTAAGQELLALIERGPTPVSRTEIRRHRKRRLTQLVILLLGPRGTNLVRRILRGAPTAASIDAAAMRTQRSEVVVVADIGSAHQMQASGRNPLVLTSDVSAELVRSGIPVEHVMQGASHLYEAERQRIVRRHFKVQTS
jgi:hypothetical protein